MLGRVNHERQCSTSRRRPVWLIERGEVRTSTQTQGAAPSVLGVGRRSAMSGERSLWSGDRSSVMTPSGVGAFACDACGAAELRAHDLSGLVANPAERVHRIGETPPRTEHG